jgi:hypothetical protein
MHIRCPMGRKERMQRVECLYSVQNFRDARLFVGSLKFVDSLVGKVCRSWWY